MLNRMFDFKWKSAWRNTTGIAVVLALVGFGAAEIAAQNTGTVTGLVLDNSVQIPLAGAQMTVDGTPIGGLVNNTGRYLLLNVPAGEQSITAQIIGYGTQTLTVTVVAGETATADFNLRQGLRLRTSKLLLLRTLVTSFRDVLPAYRLTITVAR